MHANMFLSLLDMAWSPYLCNDHKHIQHTKLTDAKFWQYANLISNEHAQYKLLLEEYVVHFLSVYSPNYALSK